MEERGVSAAAVSQATGIPKSTLSEWLGQRTPVLDESLVRLCRFFGVSLEFLITGESPEEQVVREVVADLDREFVSIHKGIYRISIEKQTSTPNKKR